MLQLFLWLLIGNSQSFSILPDLLHDICVLIIFLKRLYPSLIFWVTILFRLFIDIEGRSDAIISFDCWCSSFRWFVYWRLCRIGFQGTLWSSPQLIRITRRKPFFTFFGRQCTCKSSFLGLNRLHTLFGLCVINWVLIEHEIIIIWRLGTPKWLVIRGHVGSFSQIDCAVCALWQ